MDNQEENDSIQFADEGDDTAIPLGDALAEWVASDEGSDFFKAIGEEAEARRSLANRFYRDTELQSPKHEAL